MFRSTFKFFSLVFAFTFIAGCNAKNEYDSFIAQQGYIPFQQPLADIGVGALVTGSPNQLRIYAAAKTCFPSTYNGVATELRQVSATDLPEIAKKISLEAGVDANVIAANGTPLFKLNANFHAAKTLDVHIEGASIEYLDEINFSEWVKTSISTACKNYLTKGGSFVRQALRVDRMSFQFKNSVGGAIGLTADNLKDVIDLEANVKWEIINNYTLTITTPKYIGYHLAKVSANDPSSIVLIASSLTKDGQFDFVPVTGYKSIRRGMMTLP